MWATSPHWELNISPGSTFSSSSSSPYSLPHPSSSFGDMHFIEEFKFEMLTWNHNEKITMITLYNLKQLQRNQMMALFGNSLQIHYQMQFFYLHNTLIREVLNFLVIKKIRKYEKVKSVFISIKKNKISSRRVHFIKDEMINWLLDILCFIFILNIGILCFKFLPYICLKLK